MSPTPARRVRIERLELDLRGIAPDVAQAAARALGAALAQALAAAPRARFEPAERIDAGRIASPAAPSAHDLATGIAGRIAASARKEPR